MQYLQTAPPARASGRLLRPLRDICMREVKSMKEMNSNEMRAVNGGVTFRMGCGLKVSGWFRIWLHCKTCSWCLKRKFAP